MYEMSNFRDGQTSGMVKLLEPSGTVQVHVGMHYFCYSYLRYKQVATYNHEANTTVLDQTISLSENESNTDLNS
jgi:hypothetical protein